MEVSGQRHAPASLYPRDKTAGEHCTGGWVGLGSGLDAAIRGKILCLCRGSNTGCSVSSETIQPELPQIQD
jgi:hypothetical protein